MRNRLLAMFIAVAMLVVSGPLEIFAYTGTGIQDDQNTTSTEAAQTTEETAGDTTTDQGESGEETPEETAPADLTVTADVVDDSTANLLWYPAVSGAEYTVTLNGNVIAQTTDTSYALTDLTENTSYTVTVDATVDGVLAATGTFDFTTPVCVAPDNVQNFKTISSYLSIVLKWDEVADADSYIIRWEDSAGASGTIEVAGDETTYTKKITQKKREREYTFDIVAVKNGVESKEAATATDSCVQLMKFKVTLKNSASNRASLKPHDNIKQAATYTIKPGQKIKTIGYQEGGYYAFQKTVKGKLRTFRVARIRVGKVTVNYIGDYKTKKGEKIIKPDYTKAEAESFVNNLKIKSKTKYLIWVNQYTQRLYIFKGSKGKWKLVKQCKKDSDKGAGWLISSGKKNEPTSTGKYTIRSKEPRHHGLPTWSLTRYFSFHGKNSAWVLGWPKSGACIRNTNEHAAWIYKKCPKNTAVYVY